MSRYLKIHGVGTARSRLEQLARAEHRAMLAARGAAALRICSPLSPACCRRPLCFMSIGTESRDMSVLQLALALTQVVPSHVVAIGILTPAAAEWAGHTKRRAYSVATPACRGFHPQCHPGADQTEAFRAGGHRCARGCRCGHDVSCSYRQWADGASYATSEVSCG